MKNILMGVAGGFLFGLVIWVILPMLEVLLGRNGMWVSILAVCGATAPFVVAHIRHLTGQTRKRRWWEVEA